MEDTDNQNVQPAWTTDESEELYGFKRWGGEHFHVDESGFACIRPAGDNRSVRIMDVISEAVAAGKHAPLVIRFQDLLRYRVEQLNKAFDAAIKDEEYPGAYRGVFPIKVNQLREVVEEIIDAGSPWHYGIEAGSKPELLVALAMHEDPRSLIVCNGYKDDEYIRLALMGRKLGKEIIIVIEQLAELDVVLRQLKEIDVQPYLGIRVKLHTEGEGKWAHSSGEDAKFGLSAPEIIEATRKLKRSGLQDSLRLVHFHVGSQVPNILTIKKAVVEAARYYCELAKLGFPMRYLDVGGGLAIDYDGSRTNFESSANYNMEEYARDVVFNIKTVCASAGVKPPDIVSESGRAIVAPHSVLIVEVTDRIAKTIVSPRNPKGKKRHQILKEFDYILNRRSKLGRLERLHDALQKKEEAIALFTHGYLDLETRAEAEALFWEVCRLISEEKPGTEDGYLPDELVQMKKLLAEQYVCNLSIFQSLLDHWACKQLFPLAPVHRLQEEPLVNARLVDITCDSEGKIDNFIDLEDDVRETLPVHHLLPGKPYYLGIFLVGAYQDIMGDLHNLFGRVNEVHVFLEDDEEDGFYLEETISGSKVKDILRFIQYRGEELTRQMKKQIDLATREDQVRPREGIRMLSFYESLMDGDTYLKPKWNTKAAKRSKNSDSNGAPSAPAKKKTGGSAAVKAKGETPPRPPEKRTPRKPKPAQR